MNSVGVFREKEVHGKPFYIFTTLLSQTDNPSSSSGEEAIDSGGDEDLSFHQPRFLCPRLRSQAEYVKYNEDGRPSYDEGFAPCMISPHFPNIKGVDQQQVRFLLDPANHERIQEYIYGDVCKDPVLPLFWCENEKTNAFDSHLRCEACLMPLEISSGYYLCAAHDLIYHKECIESPLEVKAHPSFPFLSLLLCYIGADKSCSFCETQIYDRAYCCPTYNVSLHPVCALKPIPIVIDHFKRHPHPLTFFPKQASLACDVCGMIKEYIPTYVCARCVFVVHQDCIYFPYVIKISRHPHHRISFTSSLPPGKFLCGVCRQEVKYDYGAYSCNKCDDYFVHSRCAVRRDLWDGKELEGVPEEEPEVVVPPFKEIADGVILHFSHAHNLKLEINRVFDENKFCQACVLPIYEGNYFSCLDDQCDFILHVTCASAPLKMHHPLHVHSLTLKVVTNEYNGNLGRFLCNACRRMSCGFVYESSRGGWISFKLDLRCASISEPFHYEGHEHPLFLALSPREEESAICHICHGCRDPLRRCRKLNCIECNYIVCFECATLPYKARYKHDKHFLTFRKEMVANDKSDWCEACEKKIVYSGDCGFYECDEYCCTTLHVDCLLGKHPYMMKPGHIVSVGRKEFYILRNNTTSRPFCHGSKCGEERCPHRVFFEMDNLAYCSFCFW